jgi:plastocyanin
MFSLLQATGLAIAIPVLAGNIEGRVRTADSKAELSDFVIFVDDIEGPFPAPKEPAVMDQKDLQFIPHVLAVQAGTLVEFPNSDPVSHNVFSISDAKRFNLGLYQRGAARRVKFDRPGVVELLCNVHLEMSAYIVVVKNPYFAQPKADGTFRIANVPAGRHRLRSWHKRLPAREQEVEVPVEGTAQVLFEISSKNH